MLTGRYSMSFIPKFLSEFKRSYHIALPLIISELIYSLNGFIATVMIAHLGKDQLAANALVWAIYITVILLFYGILSSVGVMIAHSIGAKDHKAVGICFNQGLILASIFSIPMMLIMWFCPIILIWTGQDAAVISFAMPFFHTLIWSMLPLNIIIVIQQFLIGISKSRLVMLMSMLAVPVEIFFYYVFLFGKLGFPNLGLAGIGYALTLCYFLLATTFGLYLFFAQKLKIYHLYKKWWQINRKFLFELIRIGLPLGFMFCSEVALFAVVAIMMGLLGATVLAAYQLSYQFMMIALTVIFALMQTATVRIGNEVGRNNRAELKLIAVVNIFFGLSLVSVFSMFYIFAPRLVLGIDIDVHAANLQAMLNEAARFLPILGLLMLIDSIRLISVGLLRGLKDTRFSMFISMFGFWCIAFPSAYLFAFKFQFGGVGIWWGLVLGLFITGMMFLLRFNRMVGRVDLIGMVTKG